MSCQAGLRIREQVGISVIARSVAITSPSTDPQGTVGLVKMAMKMPDSTSDVFIPESSLQ